MAGGACMAVGVHGWGACVAGGAWLWWGGLVWLGGVHGGGACVAGGRTWYARPPPRIPRDTVGQCAGGMHPTGMLSCFALVFAFPCVIRKVYGIKTTRNSGK